MTNVVDEGAAIQALFREYQQAWTSKNARRCGELFHEQGDIIALDGEVCHGPAEIAAYYERQLSGPYRDLQVREAQFEAPRFIAPDLAVMNAQWSVIGFRNADDTPREPTLARITFVMTRRGTDWCFVAARFMVPFATGLSGVAVS
jgi:uncharacterized protein (TIGR02246 family)